MILFFDTETTGLPENWNAPLSDVDNWPRLIQLAYLVYDFNGELIFSCNEIIKPNGFIIPLEASNVHGISTQKAIEQGLDIEIILERFLYHLKKSQIIVAHNLAYDEKIIGAELYRRNKENILDSKKKICTMLSTINFCKIDGSFGYKWPKLEELHIKLFGCNFYGAHDALADIKATAKCYWELVSRNLIEKPIVSKSSNSSFIKYFKPWKYKLASNKKFLDVFSQEYFLIQDENYIYELHKQSGEIKIIHNKIENIKSKILYNNYDRIIIDENKIHFHGTNNYCHKCISDYMYIKLLKVISLTKTEAIIYYKGTGDYGYEENGLLIHDINLKTDTLKEFSKDDPDFQSKVKFNFNKWYLFGFNLISIYYKSVSSSDYFEVCIELEFLINSGTQNHKTVIAKSQIYVENISEIKTYFHPENSLLFIFTNDYFYLINLENNSLKVFNLTEYGQFDGSLVFSKPYLYISVNTGSSTTLLVLDIFMKKIDLNWLKRNILPKWFIHKIYNLVIMQDKNLEGIMLDRFNGNLIIEFETYNKRLFDFSHAKSHLQRTNHLNRSNGIKSNDASIFKMETRFSVSHDRVFLIENTNRIDKILHEVDVILNSFILEDLINEKKNKNKEIDDLPF